VPEGWDVKRRLKMWDWRALRVCDSSDQLKHIMSIWDWEAPKGSGCENSLNAVAPLQHINCFDRDVLVTMAGKAGLSPAQIPGISRPVTGVKQRIKNFVRPYYSLFVSGEVRKKGTTLFFKRSTGKDGNDEDRKP